MAAPLPKHRAREYETIFIINPDTTAEAIEQIASRVTEVIDKREGKLLRAENWGRRRLAYSVRKKRQGYYLYLRYLGYSDLVHELERNFRMIEPIIKYLTVKIDEDVDPDARPVSESDISFTPQIEEDSDESIDDTSISDLDEDSDTEDDLDDDLEEGNDDVEDDEDDEIDISPMRHDSPSRRTRNESSRESVPDVDAVDQGPPPSEGEDIGNPEGGDSEEV